jgi:hypothetical protein
MKPAIITTLVFTLCASALAAEPQQRTTDSSVKQADTPNKPAAQTSASSTTGGQASPGKRRTDRLELDTTVVTGNRELPKVLYIVPWKKADIGDLPAQPFNTLLDEALTPVDRDVFRREVTYYGAMSSGADGKTPASATPAAGPEK